METDKLPVRPAWQILLVAAPPMLVVTAGLVIFGYCYAIVRGVRVHFHGEPETPEVVEA